MDDKDLETLLLVMVGMMVLVVCELVELGSRVDVAILIAGG